MSANAGTVAWMTGGAGRAVLGTLTAGRTADLILCDGDPLADIGVLGDPSNIVCVVQDGVVTAEVRGWTAATGDALRAMLRRAGLSA